MPSGGNGADRSLGHLEVTIPTLVNTPSPSADWSARREMGSMGMLRGAVWVARRLGRPLTRWLIFPICRGFVLCHREARSASKAYLARALARPPRAWDVVRHFFSFGTTVLDRVYLL